MPVNYKRYCVAAILFVIGAFASHAPSQVQRELLGLKLRPEITAIVKEIEVKTGQRLYAEFATQPQFQLGSGFINDEDGRAVVLVDPALESDAKKLEAVVTHELLHLRLTVTGYPSFIFSPSVRTAKGRAIDVEQSNINDLRSIIEHRVFKTEMERFGLNKFIDLAGDTAEFANTRKGQEDGQNDAINYARALLEYPQPADIALVQTVYRANGWTRSLAEGKAIADIIRAAPMTSPAQVEAVFLRCLAVLYPLPGARFTFVLTSDRTNKHFRRMVVSVRTAKRK